MVTVFDQRYDRHVRCHLVVVNTAIAAAVLESFGIAAGVPAEPKPVKIGLVTQMKCGLVLVADPHDKEQRLRTVAAKSRHRAGE